MTRVSVAGFINQVLPDARIAQARTGVPVSVILAQWINETGSGTSRHWRVGHNYAGTGNVNQFGTYAEGLADYIRYLLMPNYRTVRETAAAGASAIDVAAALERSPWAAGHYGYHGLQDLIRQHNLVQYDAPVSGLGGVGVSGLRSVGELPVWASGSGRSTTFSSPTGQPLPPGGYNPDGTGSAPAIGGVPGVPIPPEGLPGPETGLPGPGDLVSGVVGAFAQLLEPITNALQRVGLYVVFVGGGLALVVLGGWRMVGPRVRQLAPSPVI